jgi:hypothetical protein
MALEKVPKGFPKRKNPEKRCSKMPINIDETKKELEEVEERINDLENANLDERFLKTVFIIVERPSDASRVIATQGNLYFKLILKFVCCCFSCCFDTCLGKGFFWHFLRAPEPSDIFWENLGIRGCQRLGRAFASLIGTSIVLVLCILVIRFIKLAQIA